MYLHVPRANPNLRFPSTHPSLNPTPNKDYLSSQVSSLTQQNQASQSNPNDPDATTSTQKKLFESQLTQMATLAQ